jgi:hypothetical protein
MIVDADSGKGAPEISLTLQDSGLFLRPGRA